MNYPNVSVVIIGRNEGDRLIRCVQAVQNLEYPSEKMEIIYVDSRSSDGSAARVRNLGVEKVYILEQEKTCAAMGRNLGLKHSKGEFILFLDGDTQISSDFLVTAIPHFEQDEIAIVYGKRIEIHPESRYIKLCGSDWSQRIPGFTETSAGDILMRSSVIKEIGGYKEIIAGEDPEMSNSVINAGYKILFLDKDMVKHDLAIYSFKQYWKHSVRSGFAYAVVADLTKERAIPLWLDKQRKIMLQGSAYLIAPFIALAASLFLRTPIPFIIYIFLGALILGRSYLKNMKKGMERKFNAIYTLHSHFLKIPLIYGQLTYRTNKNKSLIEYK